MQSIKILPTDFVGKGEVKGFHFRQIKRSSKASIYEVNVQGIIHYEVFEMRIFLTPKTKEPYEAYPKANSFGVWAWTYRDYEKAIENFNEITNYE